MESHTVSKSQESRSGVTEGSWLKDSHEDAAKLLCGVTAIWKLDWGWRMYFEDPLHGSGQESSVLSSSQWKSWLPPEQIVQEEDNQDGSGSAL